MLILCRCSSGIERSLECKRGRQKDSGNFLNTSPQRVSQLILRAECVALKEEGEKKEEEKKKCKNAAKQCRLKSRDFRKNGRDSWGGLKGLKKMAEEIFIIREKKYS